MTFPTSLDDFTEHSDDVDFCMASDINELQAAIEALEAKVGIDSSAVTTSLDYKVNKFFVSGRAVYLYQDDAAVPDGWSKVAVTDKVLAVKGGSNAYNRTGGGTAGTWTQPTHDHTVSKSGWGINFNSRSGYIASAYGGSAWEINSNLTSSSERTVTTWRPNACVGIIIEMD